MVSHLIHSTEKLLLTSLAGPHCCIVLQSSYVLFPHTPKCISERLAFCLLHSFSWYSLASHWDVKCKRQAHPLLAMVEGTSKCLGDLVNIHQRGLLFRFQFCPHDLSMTFHFRYQVINHKRLIRTVRSSSPPLLSDVCKHFSHFQVH